MKVDSGQVVAFVFALLIAILIVAVIYGAYSYGYALGRAGCQGLRLMVEVGSG